MLNTIKSEVNTNNASGALTVLFMLNYRFGRKLLILRKNGAFWLWPPYLLALFLNRVLSFVFGCSIPFSCQIGSRVCFRHGLHGIFISGKARIGNQCTILHQVTIGSNYGSSKKQSAPIIAENVFIGAGAKIIGELQIGARSKIGVNALVVNNIPEHSICLAPKATIIHTKQNTQTN